MWVAGQAETLEFSDSSEIVQQQMHEVASVWLEETSHGMMKVVCTEARRLVYACEVYGFWTILYLPKDLTCYSVYSFDY